jgi:hypothetical protein
MDKESTNGQVETYMKVIISMMNAVAKEPCTGQMEANMKGNGSKVFSMELARLLLLMELPKRVSLRTMFTKVTRN